MEENWEEWAEYHKSIGLDSRICPDGPIDEDQFRKSSPRILFVLKEPNNFPSGDLREHFGGTAYSPTKRVLGRWSLGLLGDFPPYEATNDPQACNQALRKVATINLKKVSGDRASDMWQIGAYALRDRHLLRRQIMKISPNIIIACGTYDILTWMLELNIDPHDCKKPTLSEIYSALVVPFWHPAARIRNPEKEYFRLKDVVELSQSGLESLASNNAAKITGSQSGQTDKTK